MSNFREAPDLAYRQGYGDAIRDAAQAVEALHHPKHYGEWYGLSSPLFDFYVCEECNSMCHSQEGLHCEEPGDALWPCAEMGRQTAAIRALVKEDGA